MPAFCPILETLLKRAFWYCQQPLFFYRPNGSKTLSFHQYLQFWEEGKVSGGQVRWIRWLRHDYDFVFGQKLTHKHRYVSWCVIMVQNPCLVVLQFCAFLMNCFVQSAHNFKVVFVIDRTALWQEFMMYHTITIEENSEQNLYIWLNLTLFSVLALLNASIGMIGLVSVA